METIIEILLEILKRLFIKLPLYILFGILYFTVVVPILYWVITGEGYFSLDEYIEDL